MKQLLINTAAIILAGFFLTMQTEAQELTAKEIVQKANDKANGLSSKGEIKMTIVRPGWSREVTMKTWSLTTEYYLILITGPARDKGQVFLKRDTDMWNWMPNIGRIIKLPSSMMSQSWMGSDFTNDDLVRMNSIVNDYSHKIIGSENIDGYNCYIIELIPHPEAAVVWGKVVMWIAEDEFYELKTEFYDEDMIMVNLMKSSDIAQMGDRKLPAKMVMIPQDKDGEETRMELMNMEFNAQIEESFFSQQNMKKIR